MTDITLQNFRDWVVAQPENTIFRPNSHYHCPFAEFLKSQNSKFLYCIDTDKPIDEFVTITLKLSERNRPPGTNIFFLQVNPVFIELVNSIDQSPDIIKIGQASDWNRHLPKDALLRIIDFHMEEAA